MIQLEPRALLLLLGLAPACASGARADEPPTPLAGAAYGILKQYCYRCHGVDFKVPGYNVLDRDILIAQRGDDAPYVVPGDPDASELWQRVGVEKDMPPSGKKPSDEDRATLRKWIEAGAPFPERSVPAREFRSEKDILRAIRDHLRSVPDSDQGYQRYFTLTHLYNNPRVSDDEMRLYRAALSKAANSLSWKQALALPRPVDDAATVFAVDLRDLGWDERGLWKEILKQYPYGLTHTRDRDDTMRGLATEIGQRSGTDLAYVRADWFIATATRPPLYNTLLRLPDNAGELERTLRVNVVDDFLRNKQARAGFTQSGVSSQNRVVDRHPAAYGAYWKTYDFSTTEGTGNVLQFPLGPVFVENPFPRQAFEHAGGEIIFSLPNGLHGYMLVNNKDKRIDAGPIDIVHDELATSGTPTIVAGLSCMGCHKHGMIRFKDDLRAGTAVSGEARLKLDQLIPVPENMDKLLKRDEDQFLRSLDEAAGGLLRAGDDSKKEIREFPEPVSAIARLYVKDLGAEEVALELGVPDAKKLAALVEANRRLRELGLAPLVHEGRIKRAAWESLKGFLSPFQETARELELSTPFRVF